MPKKVFTPDQERQIRSISGDKNVIVKLQSLAKSFKIPLKSVMRKWRYESTKNKKNPPKKAAGFVLYVVDNSKQISRISKMLERGIPLLDVKRKNSIPVETDYVPAIKNILKSTWPEMKFRVRKIEGHEQYSRISRTV